MRISGLYSHTFLHIPRRETELRLRGLAITFGIPVLLQLLTDEIALTGF